MSEAPRLESVAVVGAGALGAMYAAHLAAAEVEVVLVAAGERAERLRTQGLTVNGAPLDIPVLDPSTDGHAPFDLVLVAVKAAQLEDSLDLVAPLVGPDTTFVSVLNGLDSERVIGERFSPEQVLLCIALAMDAEREGSAVRYTAPGRLEIGDSPATVTPGEGGSERTEAVAELLDRAGIACTVHDDMTHRMWWKFLVNVGGNQASAATRTTYGRLRQEPARSLMVALQDEVVAVAAAEGVRLTATDVQRWYDVLEGQPADGRTSMLQDVLAGRPTEVDIFAGRVVELGRRHGIATPYNQSMLWVLSALR
ncbi:2-dehydropantoate 2-reductase [Marihabitans asiaticum]|uniref:2-dehydropantoate 2-reductase n=1 Tax=Marihabitans asiaticum TaxID=415218 RepID=A0A560W6S0_9MICO|nr:2-dehydropantoate 2-reductase [Marihabitans asiaticum]TWD13312.1 2-dehydropantoate 2-reductase [Marihabitans asiaticum]